MALTDEQIEDLIDALNADINLMESMNMKLFASDINRAKIRLMQLEAYKFGQHHIEREKSGDLKWVTLNQFVQIGVRV